MATKAVFIDRDGVINKEKEYLHRIKDFEFIDGVFDACRLFSEKGYKIIVVTNQSGIGRGYYSEQEYTRLTEWMVAQFSGQGIAVADVFYCPHHPERASGKYRRACECRKPEPGMLLTAAKKHGIDLSRSLMVGDKEADIQAGRAAGVAKTVLVRSGHPVDEHASAAEYIIDSLGELDAIQQIILEQEAEQMSEQKKKTAPQQYKVSRSDLPLVCPNKLIENGIAHPRVFLTFEDGRAVCPYCGTEYILKN